MRRSWGVALALCIALAAAAGGARAGTSGPPETLPPTVPVGFTIVAAAAAPTPTSLAFSPGGGTLYVASLAGRVLAYPVLGGRLGPPTVFLDGLNQPLGVLPTRGGVFVADSRPAGERSLGLVLRARDLDRDRVADRVETVISGLPNGRHNTNGMALGSDRMLYITNGNSTDSGFGEEGGPPEVPPYSGSILRVPPGATDLSPDPSMVVATGFRNIYDVAEFPDGHPAADPGGVRLATTMNGPDGQTYDGTERPVGEDTLSFFEATDTVVEHFGFPWCLYDRDRGGLGGFVQDPSEGSCHPLTDEAFTGLTAPGVQAFPAALFGDHVSADGLAFNSNTQFPRRFDHDLFIAEFGNLFGPQITGHKVVRVTFTASGEVDSVEDFMTGAVPLDVTFGPNGALWVADFGGAIYRIASVRGR